MQSVENWSTFQSWGQKINLKDDLQGDVND
jgi:hypothetical protein